MNQDTHTSSPGRLVALGAIVGTHGVRACFAFIRTVPFSSLPPTGRPVYLTARPAPGGDLDPSDARPIVLDAARPHGNVVLLSVAASAASKLRRRSSARLGAARARFARACPRRVLRYQLEGLDVVTNAGEHLGTIDRTFSTAPAKCWSFTTAPASTSFR